MALTLKKNSARGTVGLDIDGGFIAAVHATDGHVQSAVSTELRPGVVSEGEITDAEALGTALKDFFKENELPKAVRLGVSNQQIVVRQIDLPKIEGEKELDAAIRFQAPESIAMPLDDAVLDWQVIGETAGDEGAPRLKVVLVAARRSMVANLLHAVRSAGLKPQSVDLDAFALVRMLASPDAPGEEAQVYCHLGALTNLALAVGSSCIFTRALSTTLDGDPELAAAALADEIRLSIDYYMAQPGAQPVNEIVISGPGAQRDGIADALAEATHRPVIVANPLGALDASGLGFDGNPYRYTVAAGLAMGAAA